MSDPYREPSADFATACDLLERGRVSHARRAWGEAYDLLSRADKLGALCGTDLEMLATAAYLAGRDEDYLQVLERAHQAHLETGQDERAARCGFWLGLRLLFRGETARAAGWFARAGRLLEDRTRETGEQGLLLVPVVEQQLDAGDCDAAYTTASAAVGIGRRCGEADLVAIARHQQGRIRLRQGRIREGLALLDEAMVAVTADELSPIVTGLVYCSVIDACQQVHATDRACEWTSALAQWCEAQPEVVAFTGVCRIHRAEIMQSRGAWEEAIEEARRAGERLHGVNARAAGTALYRQAEVLRLRGEFAAAERTYREASESGHPVQPGLALLWAACGRGSAAAAAIRRAVDTTQDRLLRACLLPAAVEIMLATHDVRLAREYCADLDGIAKRFPTMVLIALAAHARGAVELAEGHTRTALNSLRDAWETWRRLDMPYEAARARMLIGLACRELGDRDGGGLELGAARLAFETLGAAHDRARCDALVASAVPTHGITARELQILRLLATGKTNKAIATELCRSVRTIDRHVASLLTKLDVPTRAAATAYAYRHGLL